MDNKSEIIESLKNNTCKVVFTKANGEERVMTCTLSESILPEIVKEIEEKAPRKKNNDALAVWDVVAKGWRSFRWDSLKSFEIETNT